MGPFEDRRGPFMRVIANADVRSVVHYVRVLRSPFLNIELFQVSTPRQQPLWPNLLDIGGWGLAAAVADVDAAVSYLPGQGGYALGAGRPPLTWGLQFRGGAGAPAAAARHPPPRAGPGGLRVAPA